MRLICFIFKLEEYFDKTKVWEPWLVVASSVSGYTRHSGQVQTACQFCLVTTITSTKSGMVESRSNYFAFSTRSQFISTSFLTAAILKSVTYSLQFTFLKSDNEPASNKTLSDVPMHWHRPTSHNGSDLWLKMHPRPQFSAYDDANATRLLRKHLNTAFPEQRITGPQPANPERPNPGLRPALLEQRRPPLAT